MVVSDFNQKLKKLKAIPIADFSDLQEALSVAELLLQNDCRFLEITLRSQNAFTCLKAIKKEFPEFTIGVGSLLHLDDYQKAVDLGAEFAVSPCIVPEILNIKEHQLFYIPSAITPTEFFSCLQAGYKVIKIFPIEQVGGISYLKSLTAPFASYDFSLIPTGGVLPENLSQYLAESNVIACGTTKITKIDFLKNNGYQKMIEGLCE